jgi:hypothetical protein
MMRFQEYVRLREGLWLNDKLAVVGMSRLNPLPKPAKPRSTAPNPIQPIAAVAQPPVRQGYDPASRTFKRLPALAVAAGGTRSV